MTALAVATTAYAAVSLLYWVWMVYAQWRTARGVPRLGALGAPEPPVWPRLSVIVPACNEADRVEAALRTLLAEDYPALELVLVDDRSTDGTGAILDRLAAGDPRVRVLHVTDLPAGWLGKVHALDRGLRASRGDLVLFTDADVEFRRGTLRRAVAYLEAEGLDHLAAVPGLHPHPLLLGAGIVCFIRQFLAAVRPWAIGRPGSRAYVGVGAFNLVRRSALEATAGLEWLRLETADDVGLGLLMRDAGARRGLVSAIGWLGLDWYRTWGEAARGAERGYASVARFSVWRMAAGTAVMTALEVSPAAAPLAGALAGAPAAMGVGLAATAAFLVSVALLRRWTGGRVLPMLLGPAVVLVLAALSVRAGALGWWRGGVMWRGTLYPTGVLRPGSRVRFPP